MTKLFVCSWSLAFKFASLTLLFFNRISFFTFISLFSLCVFELWSEMWPECFGFLWFVTDCFEHVPSWEAPLTYILLWFVFNKWFPNVPSWTWCLNITHVRCLIHVLHCVESDWRASAPRCNVCIWLSKDVWMPSVVWAVQPLILPQYLSLVLSIFVSHTHSALIFVLLWRGLESSFVQMPPQYSPLFNYLASFLWLVSFFHPVIPFFIYISTRQAPTGNKNWLWQVN